MAKNKQLIDDEITIVTSFFDIGRGQYQDRETARSNDKYLSFFRFWSKMKNHVILYADYDTCQRAKAIREEHGLGNKTTTIAIDDVTALEADMFAAMAKMERDGYYRSFRSRPHLPENTALYDYIMVMKSWCMQDAVNRGLVKTDVMAWLDFGFNHGGKLYPNADEFDFLWRYNPQSKVIYFALKDDDDTPIFRTIQSFDVVMTGGVFIMPTDMAAQHWKLIRSVNQSLIDCGFIDDDQVVMLMAYRRSPEMFHVIICDWFYGIKLCGGDHLMVTSPQQHSISLQRRWLTAVSAARRRCRYAYQFYVNFVKELYR